MAKEFLSDEEMEKLEKAEKKSPSDQRALFAKGQNLDLLQKFKEAGYKTQLPGFAKDALNFGVGAADQATMENLRPDFKKALEAAKEESPISTTFGQGAGLAGVTLGSMAIPGGPLVKGAVNLAQGALTKPEGDNSFSEDITRRGIDAAAAPVVGGAIRGAGKGLKYVGDRLMQKAVGRTKITPGVGTELVEAGIFRPTREGMKNQVMRKKDAAYDKMRQAVVGNPSMNPTQPVADQVRQMTRKMEVPGGQPSASDIPAIREINDFAADIDVRGFEDPLQMLSRRAAAGNRGYDNVTDVAKKSLLGKMSKQEQIGYSRELKKAVPELIPIDKRYAALSKASKSLNRDAPIYQGWGVPGLATKGALAAGGAAAGGAPGAVTGLLLSTPGGQAAAAHLLTRGGQALPAAIPAAISGISNIGAPAQKKAGFLSDEEMEALEAGGNESDKRAREKKK